MRFESTDCILFPGLAAGQPHGAGQPPRREFRTNCFAVRDASLVAGAIITAPLLHCFTPSMAAGEPFQVSIHDWEPKGFHLPNSTVHHVKIVIDGMVQHAEPFEMTVGWPKLIIGGNAQLRADGLPELLRFPDFNPAVMSEAQWNAYDEAGRIKVELSEGYIEQFTQRYVKTMTYVIFNFQPAPMDVLQTANIAWPNPSMMHNPILAPSMLHPNPLASAQNNPPPPMAPFAQALAPAYQQEPLSFHLIYAPRAPPFIPAALPPPRPMPRTFKGTVKRNTDKTQGRVGLMMKNPNVEMYIPGEQVDKVLDRLNVRLAPGAENKDAGVVIANAGPGDGPGPGTGAGAGAMLPPPLPNRRRYRQDAGVQTINKNSQAVSQKDRDHDANTSTRKPSDRDEPKKPMSGSSEDASSINSAVMAFSSLTSSPAPHPVPPFELLSKKRARALTHDSQPGEREDSPPKKQKISDEKQDMKAPKEAEAEAKARRIVFAGSEDA